MARSEAQFGPGVPGHPHGRASHPAPNRPAPNKPARQTGDWCGGVSAPDPGWCGGGEPPRPWCDSARAPVEASTGQASTGLVVLGALAGLARALGRRSEHKPDS